MPEKQLPKGRSQRLWQLGRLAGSVAMGALGESARQLGRGERPSLRDSVLSTRNLTKVRDRLSEMRGAAMKVGQLISMESGEVLPAEFAELFSKLREDAHFMPLGEVAKLLKAEWGEQWDQKFERFNFQPIAAASIGQVHRASTRDGHDMAIKLQYPGVRESIDSDINNVAMLLNWSGLLPDGIDLKPLLDDAKRQLHAEADYRLEADMLKQFADLVGDDERFQLPKVIDAFSSENILAMEFLDGEAIESLEDAKADERNRVAQLLLELGLREVFEWGLVQTDPNFANYRYQPNTRRLQLLDFGASRAYTPERLSHLKQLLGAGLNDQTEALESAAHGMGYLSGDEPDAHRLGMLDLLHGAFEPLRSEHYDFARTDLAKRMSERVITLRNTHEFTLLPPSDVLFLHRKLGGLYLLMRRLRAQLPVRQIVEDTLNAQLGRVSHA